MGPPASAGDAADAENERESEPLPGRVVEYALDLLDLLGFV
jgi:hypothetical protein